MYAQKNTIILIIIYFPNFHAQVQTKVFIQSSKSVELENVDTMITTFRICNCTLYAGIVCVCACAHLCACACVRVRACVCVCVCDFLYTGTVQPEIFIQSSEGVV
jgi:hypothetical protein